MSETRGAPAVMPKFAPPSPETATDILFTGNGGDPNKDGPLPEIQMGVWVNYYNGNTQQYFGSNNCKDETCETYAKYRTAKIDFSTYSNEQMVSLTCYSGGVEACIMFADMYIEGGGTVFSMALIGGTYVSRNEQGVEQGFDYWSARVQSLVDQGVNILVYDDVVYGDQHHGSLGIQATERGSYREISTDRIHYNNQGDWASNMNPGLAEKISIWHNRLWFSIGLYEYEGYPSE